MAELDSEGGLHIVSVPIGNLGDLSERAKTLLASVDRIACEDTRVTGKLLDKLGIKTKASLFSYRDENEGLLSEQIVAEIHSGAHYALLSDAGTPAISDPGFRLIRACRKAGLAVTALPGACALINALCLSGLPTDGFLFLGFLPPKTAARKKAFTTYRELPYTLILYESCHRIEKCIDDIITVLGPDRVISVCREMTKLHETVSTGRAESVRKEIEKRSKKGEFVVLIAKQSYQH